MTGWQDRVLAATAAVSILRGGPLIGTGVLIESDRLLTCRHVVSIDGTPAGVLREKVTVTFPDCEPLTAIPLDEADGADAVLLEVVELDNYDDTLEQPTLPTPVHISGRTRPPQNVQLLGYPSRDTSQDGIWKSFVVRGPTASGQVQLGWVDTGSLNGHSGGPVVDADTGELVGLMREGSEIGRFDRYIPVTLLYRRGLLRWLPWLFGGDDAIGHFTRRARGQRGVDSSSGDMFQGRTAALVKITTWLSSHETPGQVLVISGQPGAGKSAVISRAGLAIARLKQGDHHWHGLFFHARLATSRNFQKSLADLTGVEDYESPSTLLSEIDKVGEVNPESRWVIVVDALDEAFSRGDRIGIASLLAELAHRPWVRASVATRPLAAAGPFSPTSLLRHFGVMNESARNLVDLDSEVYFNPDDLVRFTRMLLSQSTVSYPAPRQGAWRDYRADPTLVSRLANAIADKARRNFLVAALTAVRLSEQDSVCDPAIPGFSEVSLPASLGDALDLYLETRADPHRFRGILTSLAYAEGSGMDEIVWMLSSQALGYPVSQAELDDLRTSSIADYLLETTTEHEGTLVRLFHQALNDQLLESRNRRHDQNKLVNAFVQSVRANGGWANAAPYMLRHLTDHAVQIGRLAELVADPDFLLRADLAIINARAGRMPPSDRPPQAWVTLRAGAAAYNLPINQRARLLAIVAAHLGLSSLSQELIAHAEILLEPVWAHTLGSAHTRLTGHTGGVQAVTAVLMADGHALIASASTDHTVRIWDPDSGQPVGQPLSGHAGRVQAVTALSMPDGRTLIASASTDHTVRIWDPDTRRQIGEPLKGHTDWVQAVAAVPMPDGRVFLASAGDDGTIRIWNPDTGMPTNQMLTGNSGSVWALAAIRMSDGRTLLASGSVDATIRIWDAASGLPVGQPMLGHTAGILSLAAIPMPDGRTLLASGGQDGSVRLWDPETGRAVGEPMTGHTGSVWAVAAVPMPDGDTLLASAGDDGIVLLRNPRLGTDAPAEELTGHSGPVEAVAAVPIPDGRTMLVSAGADGSVHLCDADTGLLPGNALPGHDDWVWAMTAVNMSNGNIVLASGGTDAAVRIWDPHTGRAVYHPFTGHVGPVWAVAAVTMPDRSTILASAGYGDVILLWDPDRGVSFDLTFNVHDDMPLGGDRTSGVEALASISTPDRQGSLLASAGTNGVIRLWDLTTGRPSGQPLIGHTGMARALAAVPMPDGQTFLASAGHDGTVRLWDPSSCREIFSPMTGHVGPVSALAAVPMAGGQTLLASASLDTTLRLWNPANGSSVGTPMIGHTGRIRAVAAVPLPDGRIILASSGTDSTVRLWDPSTGMPVGEPTVVAESVTSIAVLDGRIAIASEHAICMFALRLETLYRHLS